MRSNIIAIAGALIISGFMATGCGSSEDRAREDVKDAQENVAEAQNDLNKANAEYEAEIEEYRRTMVDRSEANNRTIDELKANVDKQRKEAREEYRQKVAALEEKNRELKARMSDYKADGKDKWENFKTEFNRDMDNLGQALSDLGKNNVK
ncbi:hypothetical protein GCM10023093_05700 [Nemorincola caseinilytica]|uniref:Uncharacterized protein n=1 Tax=Nemorincola caseinilytica TaxID=2054315 RepID=A0ABP8N4P4_9BACT